MSDLSKVTEFNQIVEGVARGKKLLVYGLSGGQKGFLLANLVKETKKKILFINNNHSSSERLTNELKTYLGQGKVGLFPSNPLLPGEVDYRSKDIEIQRLSIISKALEGDIEIIITPIQNLLEILPDLQTIKEARLNIYVGQDIEYKEIEKQLIRLGYLRSSIVEKPGDFSIRGSIVDIYPSVDERPIRVEFFGDTVESIRYFDVESQRSQGEVERLDIFTNTLNIASESQEFRLVEKLKKYSKQARDNRLRQKLLLDIEKIEHNLSFESLGQYSYELHAGGSSLLDILQDYVIILDETPFVKKDLESWDKDYQERLGSLIDKGEVVGKIPLYHSTDKILNRINSRIVLHFCLLLRTLGAFQIDETISMPFRQAPVFAGNIELFLTEVNKLVKEGYLVKIFYRKEEVKSNLISEFKEKQIKISSGSEPGVYIQFGHLEEGFIFDKGKIAFFVEGQIYKGIRGKKSKGLQQGITLTDISKLDAGDYVVHVNHGIGVFRGINTLEVGGGKKDYIHVQYADNDKLFIPTDQLHLIQKYIGGEAKEPKIYRLSGSDWVKTTKKARESIREMAQNLVYLYAERQSSQGHKFSEDTPWQIQFEDNFPYTETKDQLLAINETKKDMEQSKPMDRLLCGDVGYGKTEVAMRAAMKAVLEGKQVVVLVPTTILAQQHYKNFKERFADFPVNIEVFSRFRTKKQNDEGLIKLATGLIDIAIGTHKLLQKNVSFKDLGLIIVDEEQRFGVTHKERLKELKSNVDVLTMTATPIPRTLHMSMLGIRDLSVIETPPEDRFPVQTYVLEYNDDIITTAIKREIERSGQVYFVYNRVQNIQAMATKIQKLLPECRIAIGHGQMSETELEKTMLEFLEGEHDILLTTTIIETGLDIPNVNTLIVFDADKFGLSQLYQLRGRVGRSNRIAYCYLTYQKDKVLTEVAQKRLQAIKEFTDLGSGFKIAMRDLQIRGAGNILGLEQHGFIASIGFDLYCQLLEEAISELKGQKKGEQPLEISLELPVDAYIPDKTMSRSLKMAFYRRLSMLKSLEMLAEIEEELIDRFGELPLQTANLLDITRLKVMGQRLKIKTIIGRGISYLQNKSNKYSVEIKFYPSTEITGKDMLDIYQGNRNLDFSAKNSIITIRVKEVDKENILGEIEKLLHQLISK